MMIFSKLLILVISVLLLFSIFLANFFSNLATDHNFNPEPTIGGENHSKYLEEKYGRITDTINNLVWFLQISDIHISIFRDPSRISQFQQFCDNTVRKIKPIVVLATGDLTDAKTKDNLGSSQVKREWIYYHNIVQESGVTEDTVWLDVRGNHDNFNINDINSKDNYYRNYSVQGKNHTKSYMHIAEKNGVSLAFIGIDACPDPGVKRPFNFVGMLDSEEQQNIRMLHDDAVAKADHVVWFAHYPTSCILTRENEAGMLDLQDLIGSNLKSQVYVCGHLHTMGGFVKEMYTRQRKGFLELELGDWKDNRMFRLAAIDHGLLSFVDQRHNTWPLVLVTNPKHTRFIVPGREPLDLIASSQYIRILAFSDVNIENVKVSFDKESWVQCRHKEGPLYVCNWVPSLFSKGVHILHVMVSDEVGREAVIGHPFSLDRSRMEYDIKARMLLMLNAKPVFQGLFATLLLISVLPMVFLRLQKKPLKPSRRFGSIALRKLWLLSKIDKIFYPFILYVVYLPVGPWAVGELIDGYIGAIFAWGIVVKGAYLPEPFTYMYGSVQLAFVHIPLMFVLAYTLDTRLQYYNLRGFTKLIRNLPFICLLSVQLLLAYFFWLEYGTISLIFGPLRSWSIVLSIVLWYKMISLSPEYCRKLLNLSSMAAP